MTRRPRRSPFFPYTPLSRSRRPGFFPQARPAELVDDGPAGREPVSLFGGRHRREHLASHLGDQRPEGLLHVLRLLVFVVRPLPVEPQHGDPPPVHGARIDLAIAVVIRDHLAAAREADRGAVVAAVVVPWLFSVAPPRRGGGDAAHETFSRPPRAAPHFPVVSVMYFPTVPLALARPFGYRPDLEFSSSRADSRALAASTTTRARTWRSAPVVLST